MDSMLAEPASGTVLIAIINWVLGLLGLVCFVGLLAFPLATIIAALVEGNRPLTAGQKRSWKKTKIFALLSGLAVLGLVIILILWGIAVYVINSGLTTAV